MDYTVGLPRITKQNDTSWVIIDRLTKIAHFLALKTTYTFEKLVDLYIKEIVRLHGIPLSIVWEPDNKFISKFRHSFQAAMGTELHMSTTFDAQTDGQ